MSPDIRRGQPAYIVTWWCEAEAAIRAGHRARARRFLRWLLAACPDDDNAWLEMARLARTPEERLVYLRRATDFCPASRPIQAAFREACAQQLALHSGPLDPHRRIARCLPHRTQALKVESSRLQASSKLQVEGSRLKVASSRLKLQLSTWNLQPSTFNLQLLPALAAFLLPLLAYLLTLCPTVYNLDSAEFSAAAYDLGLVRATGYPVYLLLGKVFTLLPVGNVAFRLNLMSALCAAGTCALLYHLVTRLTGQRAAALAASLLFAFSYYFWAEAVAAEVYALHTLFLFALLAVLLRWEATRADRWLALFGLLYGLSFGNHMSTVLLAPAFAVFILWVGGRQLLRPRRLVLLVVPFVAGLACYLYLPIRYLAHPAFNYAGEYSASGEFVPLDLTRPANIWWLISGQGFRHLMFDYPMLDLAREFGQSLWRLWGSFLGIGLVPGLLGAWQQARTRPRHLALFGLILAANLLFFTGYRIVDKETQFLPVYGVWAVWVGLGYAWLVGWVQDHRSATASRRPAWAWSLAALAVVALVVNWPRVDLSHDTRAHDRARTSLALAGPDALILGWWSSVPAMNYMQIVEEQRPDVLVINRFLIGADEMYALIDRSLGRRPVYVMELDDGLIGAYQPVPVGPMFELTTRLAASKGP